MATYIYIYIHILLHVNAINIMQIDQIMYRGSMYSLPQGLNSLGSILLNSIWYTLLKSLGYSLMNSLRYNRLTCCIVYWIDYGIAYSILGYSLLNNLIYSLMKNPKGQPTEQPDSCGKPMLLFKNPRVWPDENALFEPSFKTHICLYLVSQLVCVLNLGLKLVCFLNTVRNCILNTR